MVPRPRRPGSRTKVWVLLVLTQTLPGWADFGGAALRAWLQIAMRRCWVSVTSWATLTFGGPIALGSGCVLRCGFLTQGPNKALVLPALKRVTRVETLSGSAKALPPA
jgi:hypothetical protein